MSPLLRANSATSASLISRSKSAVRPTRRAATGRTTASGNSMVVLQSVTLQLVVVQVIQDQIKGNEFRQNIVVEFHPELLLDHIGQDYSRQRVPRGHGGGTRGIHLRRFEVGEHQ